jgi:hypothetical protein
MKFDPKREIDAYRARRGVFEVVTVPAMRYLMIDGRGDPNTSPAYADAIATLYPVAYKLKFRSKRELDRDYVVGPLEALWWSEDMAAFTEARDKMQWEWTVMNLVPDWVTDDQVEDARTDVARAGGAPALASLRSTRASSCRPCTSARTRTRRRCSPRCTTSSSLRTTLR